MLSMAEKLVNAKLLWSGEFQAGVDALLSGVDITWDQKALKIPTPGTETAVLGFLTEMPEFTRFTGETNYIRPKVGAHSVKNEDYRWATSIGKNDIKYDKFAMFNTRFRTGGAASKRFYERFVSLLQKNGKNDTYGLCFDGQYFYDTDHPTGLDGSGAVFSNLWTSMTFSKANIATRYQYMVDLKDARGNNLGIRPNIIEYGPGRLLDGIDIFDSSIIANAAGTASQSNSAMNWLKAMGLQPIMNPNLGESGAWYLHDTRIIKPFIITEETPPTGVQARENPDDPSVWENNEFLYKADATAGFTYGVPHTSCRNEE